MSVKKITELVKTGPGFLQPGRFFIFLTIPFFLSIAYVSYRFHFHHDIDGDTPSYIAIAAKYYEQNFFNAINGYWSPLYSWLLTPFLVTGVDPDKLLGIINVAAAFITLFQLVKIIQLMPLLYYFNILVQLSFAFSLGYFCFIHITPDLLNLLFIVVYLRLYLQNKLFAKPIITGLLGTFLYLSKYYTFWFFIFHLTYTFLTDHFLLKKKIFKAYLLSLLCFILSAGIWIICLYTKYNQFMVSYSGSYNHAITASGEIMHTWDKNGLMPPAKGNYSAWEDIMLTYKYKDWNPFESRENFQKQISIIKKNINYFIGFLNANTRYGFYINLLILIGLLLYKRNRLLTDINFRLISFGLIYVSGYLLVLLCNDRYIWILYILSTFSIAIFLSNLLKGTEVLWTHLIASLLIVYCFNKKTFDKLPKSGTQDFDSLPENIQLLKQTIQPYQHIASYEYFTAGHFPIDTKSSYFGNCIGYGSDSVTFLNDLKKYKISFLIYSDTIQKSPPGFFLKFKKINKPFIHLNVLEVRESTLDSLLNNQTFK